MYTRMTLIPLLVAGLLTSSVFAQQNFSTTTQSPVPGFGAFQDRPSDCPPCPACFNCNLEQFECRNNGTCNIGTGSCLCPSGFGGETCLEPQCGSLAMPDTDRPLRGEGQKECDCEAGWEGVNCNVCQTNDACDAMMPEKKDGVCYKQGLVQQQNYQVCKVTNKKIQDILGERQGQVTFSCKNETQTCNFQFWVEQVESFYCGLDTCTWNMQSSDNKNVTNYRCENVHCRCVPGQELCGKSLINLGDFMKNDIKGPATFKTTSTEGGSPDDRSEFSEPSMDGLISNMFGDSSIFLSCDAGECLYKTDVPGFTKPLKKINTPLIAGVIAGVALFVVAVILGIWFYTRRADKRSGFLYLSQEDDDAQLMADHKPAALHFENLSYELNGRYILSGIQGSVHPGELLAIMGASGAGKTTFLDILARKNKKGNISGESYLNGELVKTSDFRNVIGFVDQDDTMLPTLTVHETILDSACLRLPKDMSYQSKLQRVEDVEKQLGIHHIRNQVIGSEESNGRGISGGEKRRVGIACELVTSPSILFLDEPTSGLDAYNAFNVVECLVNLVKNYNRTVVLTIHQPRSNIVALFDRLVLLASGRVVYSGPFSSCQDYFDSIGYACPPGFNIADYLVDLTMHAGKAKTAVDDLVEAERDVETRASSTMAVKSIASTNVDPIQSGGDSRSASLDFSRRPKGARRASLRLQQDRQLYGRKGFTGESGVTSPSAANSEAGDLLEADRDGAQPWLKLSKQTGQPPPQIMEDPHLLPPNAHGDSDLFALFESYSASQVANGVREDIREIVASAEEANGSPNPRETELNGNGLSKIPRSKFGGYRKVGPLGQFKILSVRTWRNLYRNPMLMLTHYAIAILLAVLLGVLFYGLTDDIAGFQNRLGLFFFILALWGFSTLTILTLFGSERLLFTRERAKGYYVPIAYFTAKVLFDVVPLRLIPPIILGVIVYPMTGLIPDWGHFFTFLLFLVLFNLAAAAVCLFLGVIFKNIGLANLVGSLVMLGSLLFSGFLLNQSTIPKAALWLQSLSIFHYGFEGLIVNEVRYLSLVDHKYGLNIEVPGASILSSFGFNNLALWTDAIGLAVFCGIFIVLAYGAMHFLLVERR